MTGALSSISDDDPRNDRNADEDSVPQRADPENRVAIVAHLSSYILFQARGIYNLYFADEPPILR